MKERVEIQLKFYDIVIEEFAFIDQNIPSPKIQGDSEDYNFKTNINIAIVSDESNRTVGVSTKFNFLDEEKVFLVAKITCHFALHEESWDVLISEGDNKKRSLVLDKPLLASLLDLSIGSCRGFIHAKRPKGFKKLIVPIVKSDEVFQQGILIDLEEKDAKE